MSVALMGPGGSGGGKHDVAFAVWYTQYVVAADAYCVFGAMCVPDKDAKTFAAKSNFESAVGNYINLYRNEKGDDKAVVTIKCVKSCNCDIYYYGTSLTKTENKKLTTGDSVTISLKNTSTYGVIVVDAYQ